jgi:hypothetical protein
VVVGLEIEEEEQVALGTEIGAAAAAAAAAAGIFQSCFVLFRCFFVLQV